VGKPLLSVGLRCFEQSWGGGSLIGCGEGSVVRGFGGESCIGTSLEQISFRKLLMLSLVSGRWCLSGFCGGEEVSGGPLQDD